MKRAEQPLISIVTSNFNQGRYIRNLLAWLRQEKRPQHELVVVDARSTDDSLAVIAKAGGLVDRFDSAADQGPADGWRRGVQLATGQYVIFVNADDALLPGALARMEAAISALPEVDIFLGHGLIVDERHHKSRFFYSHRPSFFRLALGISVACQQSTIYRSSLLSTHPINIANRTCWDAELLVDCLAAGANAKRVDEIWGAFRLSDVSISGRAPSDESVARYLRDKNNIAAKYGIGRMPEFVQSTIGRIEKVLDPQYFLGLSRAMRFRQIRSMDLLWPA